MMKVGEIGHGLDIGYKSDNNFMWASCVECGKERWVMMSHGEPKSKRCPACGMRSVRQRVRGENHPRWNGGRWINQGYVMVMVSLDSPFYKMAVRPHGYCFEHRIVMANYLGRCLKPWETVHHKNHIKDDNRIDNLEVLSRRSHNQISIMEEKVKRLEKRVTLLEAENTMLRSQYERADKY